MWDGFNQRKFPRLAAECQIQCSPYRSHRRMKAKTRNIGLGGVCVYLEKPLRRFARCRLTLRLNKKYKILQCEGRVAWQVHPRVLLRWTDPVGNILRGTNLTRSPEQREGQVKTQREGRTPKRLYDTGIEFVDSPPEMLKILEKFLGGRTQSARV